MKKWPKRISISSAALVAVLVVAVFGWNPFATYRDTSGVLDDGYSSFETGYHRQPNGVYRVRALTRMPNVKAKMVRWWFADYMQTTEHYKRWHPMAHVWMDWENKVPGEIVGASHLVHEYIGDDLSKLRIQFVDAEEFFGPLEEREDQFVLCARVGELEQPLNMATMCHYVRDTPFGAEMRSTFWLGHIAKRNGNDTIFSIEGLLGNTMLARYAMAGEQLANNLMTHAIQEMGNLADFLPQLYAEEANEQRTSSEGDQPSKPRTTQPIDDRSKQSLDDRTGHRPERDGAAIANASGWPNVAAQDDAAIGQR